MLADRTSVHKNIFPLTSVQTFVYLFDDAEVDKPRKVIARKTGRTQHLPLTAIDEFTAGLFFLFGKNSEQSNEHLESEEEEILRPLARRLASIRYRYFNEHI